MIVLTHDICLLMYGGYLSDLERGHAERSSLEFAVRRYC